MGRVRRYKKIKSIDPFAKKQKIEIDTIHDEPPNLFKERENKIELKKNKIDKNLLSQYRKAAKETIVIDHNNNNNNNNKLKDEKKIVVNKIKKGETLKEFNKRIRQNTRLTLREEFKKNSSTFQKRKEKLKERKLTKKLKKKDSDIHNLQNNENFQNFGASETGHVRPSDLENAKTAFTSTERIQFGERVDCPPDFRQVFQYSGAKKAGLGTELKKRKRNDSNEHDNNSGNNIGGDGADEKNMLKMVMEREKIRVVEAYKALQKKRRDEQGRNFSTLE